jgi:hypothetical protein
MWPHTREIRYEFLDNVAGERRGMIIVVVVLFTYIDSLVQVYWILWNPRFGWYRNQDWWIIASAKFLLVLLLLTEKKELREQGSCRKKEEKVTGSSSAVYPPRAYG